MVVTVSSWELSIPGSDSLKAKRSVLRSLKDRLGRLNVSVIESGLQDDRRRARVSVAFLAAHNAQADAILESVDRVVAGARGALVLSSNTERW
ncbi:MAG: DUF503 domain-containing protein [Gemmatimonadota bacterium]|nr:DUF503 domain-containing protein [Gemmatimonadota bacterium]